MKLAITKTVTLNKAERDVLVLFEEMIEEMDLTAEEIEELLFAIYRDKDKACMGNISIKYEL